MKKRQKKTLIPIHLVFGAIFLATSSAFPENVDIRTAFTVRDIGITVYETKKNVTRAIEMFQYENKSLPAREWVKAWLTEFIDRSYFLENAYEKGYFKKPSLETDVESMSRIVVTQDGGFLEKELVKDISVSESEVKIAYEKAKTKYTLSYIVFDDRNALERIVGGDTMNVTPKQFKKWYAMVGNPGQKNAVCGKNIFLWPFWNFMELEATIIGLPENTVAGPISTRDGINYICMEKREVDTSLPPYDETIKKRLENIVRKYKECVIMEHFRSTVQKKTVTSIQPMVFEDVFERIQRNGGVATLYEEYRRNDALLFSCRYEGRLIGMKVGEFLKDCGITLQNEKIDSRPALRKRITQKAFTLCAYVEAEKRGITKTKQFILDRINYANSLAHDVYEKTELTDKRPVTEIDMRKEYSDNQERYIDGVCTTSARFIFKSRDAARKGSGDVFRRFREAGKGQDWIPQTLDGLVSVTPGFTVRHDSGDIPPTVKDILFRMLPGQVTAALDMGNGTYGVFVKESESGSRVRAFDEVRDEIRKNVAADRLKLNKEARLKELKRKYSIKFAVPKETLLKSILDSHPELPVSGG